MTNENTILDLGTHELFARQAERRPDATAVLEATGPTSYRALAAKASAIADGLRARGLRAEQPVVVLAADRTSDLVAALLGVLEAGGCYVPIDSDVPPDQIRHIIANTKCELLLGRRARLTTCQEHLKDSDRPIQFVAIEDLSPGEFGGGSVASADSSLVTRTPRAPGGRRLAYILFTSGSTGKPKGVEVEHRSMVNLLLALRDLIAFTEVDRFLAVSKIGFDISVGEVFLPLITGGTVVLCERELVMNPRRLAQTLRDRAVTVFQTGPAVWSVLLAEVPDFPRLRVAITGGEAIAPDRARQLTGVADDVWNLYGPTETTVYATGHRLVATPDTVPSLSSISAPIGRALTHVKVKVLDEHLAPVAIGMEGELWLGGACLARGYCNNEALTRERFVVLGDDGERFYRTGDVVVEDPEGRLHYFGRNDDQIKARGVRIEPMEVESAILKHPAVAQTAATWYATASDSRAIVAAVVPRPGQHITPDALHRHLEGLLLPAAIPSRFLICEALPLAPTGKVDRKAIRARVAETPVEASATSDLDDTTATERALIRIWEKTLNIRPITRDHHFFTIGGDSLSAVTMLLEAESVFDLSLGIRVVFESPTVRQLAGYIDRSRAQVGELGNAAYVFPLSPQGRGAPVFFNSIDLKMARQGMWTADCPLYAISLWALGHGFVEATSIEELARVNIESIQAIQPRGPYRLAGYSFGSLVALEIAQQLRRMGQTVELLFLLDPVAPSAARPAGSVPRPAPDRGRVADTQAAQGRGETEHPGGLRRAWHWLRRSPSRIGRTLWQWVSYHRVHLYGRHANPISELLLPKNRWPAFWYAAKHLAKQYSPQPYDGSVCAVFVEGSQAQARWTELLPPSADIQFIQAKPAELFVQPACSLWMESLRSRLDSKLGQKVSGP